MYELNIDQIKKLWILDLIIQTKSIKQTALMIKVTPSAISQTLSSLEKMVGKPLIVRNKNSFEPTIHAKNILELVRPAFEIFDQLKSINSESVPNLSWVHLGTYESIAIDLLPEFIKIFREKLPKAKLKISVARTSQLLTQVRKGELCAAIISENDELEKFYQIEIGIDRLGFYVSKKHSIAHLGWGAVEKYGFGCISFNKVGLPRYFKKYLSQFEKLRPNVVSESFETLRAAASQGVIASILPHRVAMRSEDLIEIHPKVNLKQTGEHKILLVSQLSCDRIENDFIAAEARRVLFKSV